MSESKLPLLTETISFPYRPARRVALRFYEDGIECDIVHNSTERVMAGFHCRYSDGDKTRGTLTPEVVGRVKSNLSKAVARYDTFRGDELRQLFSKLNPINQIREDIGNVSNKLSGKIEAMIYFTALSSR